MNPHLAYLFTLMSLLPSSLAIASARLGSPDTVSTAVLTENTLEGFFADIILTNDVETIQNTLAIGTPDNFHISPVVVQQAITTLPRIGAFLDTSLHLFTLLCAALATARADTASIAFAHLMLTNDVKLVQRCLTNRTLTAQVACDALEIIKDKEPRYRKLQLLEAAKKTCRLDMAVIAFSYIAEETDHNMIANFLKIRDTSDQIYLIIIPVVVEFVKHFGVSSEQLALLTAAAETAERPDIVELLTKLAAARAAANPA